MKKVIPKFTTKFLNHETPDDPRIERLKYWCMEFIKEDLMPSYGDGAYGNLSFRLKEGFCEFIVTASGLKSVSAESFVKVTSIDFDRQTVYVQGTRAPSSESMFHFLIYQKRKDVNAIFHGHSQKILDIAEELKLPSTLKEEPYGTLELAKAILDILNENNFIIIKNHGFLAFGKTMDIAGARALSFC
ncbi:hypothetical protein A2526_03875 [candidate division WOR-1 bacterium RIFOXYD2_FULL_36_8]|uniref:Class II aldolase/adducin N-terminal domain-containing protein n=1 Tax=candidate division WOR-1 bacterium RIFOXYB2_FULL_36_35 TaxID=1802578 RepID=A0A1F4S5Z5_UNCSA|nr:MAG: hypothetical protein A2230_02090 [candidate division WOR-1 bacterium RIFOXYA2_FULL_36_21]OGC15858.1 MAG: hypothetical protein A2290_05935 [candidate division WOR-1 bacterium RIFOXYB2_FULL_36_35]OGC21190.1 MAG: hypothetical protein A2282_05955 [candidate division WOR-1 bacterium RIFOXYA12_FULL_36_13]OGC38816.1 MAG: hypothetical protein A2526_03875 [candidate division WOR-1 bacterium RIFOXYD2_FULL_36_8]